MTYAKERYGVLLDKVNQVFSSQFSSLATPRELTDVGISSLNEESIKTIKSNLLHPLPLVLNTFSPDFETSSKGSVTELEKPDNVTLPSLSSLKCRVYDVWQNTRDSGPTVLQDTRAERLELIFLSQVACAIQCLIIDIILRDIIPLSDAIQTWARYRGGLGRNLLYVSESIPHLAYVGVRSAISLGLSQKFNLENVFTFGRKILHSPIHSIYTSPLKVIKLEIESSRDKLGRLRELNGAALGLICEQPDILEDCEKDISKVPVYLKKTAEALSVILDNLQEPPKSSLQLDYLIKINEEEIASPDISDIYMKFDELIQKLDKHQNVVSSQVKVIGPPGLLSQLFLPSIASLFTFKSISGLILANKSDIITYALDAKEIMFSFFKNWIIEPLQDILDTIRHKDKQLLVMSQASLDSDIKSLERMVVEFASSRKSGNFDPTHEKLKIQEGDMSTVLLAYEKAIKNPITSAVFGDLIQTLLIQAQKAKVDASLALNALDTLLKSNELTFGLIAFIPPVILAWYSVTIVRRWCLSRTGKSKAQVARKARLTVERIFRILNEQLGSVDRNNQERYIKQGFLLCEVHYLRRLVPSLHALKVEEERRMFLKSIRDLESFSLSPTQRLNVLQHMQLSYPFLALRSSSY